VRRPTAIPSSVNAQNAINATPYDKLSFDFIRDIAPAAGIFRVPLVMEPSVPAKWRAPQK
jgi:hypothetical protein